MVQIQSERTSNNPAVIVTPDETSSTVPSLATSTTDDKKRLCSFITSVQPSTQAKQAQVAFNLARNYLDEYSAASTTRDRQSSAHKAVKFLTQAADKCSVDAMLMLYEVYQGLRLDGIFKDDADPLMWLKQAAKRGHHVAQHNMGFTAQKKKKISLALKWYSRAAAQGIPESMYALVKIYWEDKNDHKTAVEWAIKAFKSATAGQWKNDILAAHVCESIAGIEHRSSNDAMTFVAWMARGIDLLAWPSALTLKHRTEKKM